MGTIVAVLQPTIFATFAIGTPAFSMRETAVCLRSWKRQASGFSFSGCAALPSVSSCSSFRARIFAPFEWFEDEEAYLLFRLVNDVNFTILNNTDKNRDLRFFAHCALGGVVRQISRPDQFGSLVPVYPIPEAARYVGE